MNFKNRINEWQKIMQTKSSEQSEKCILYKKYKSGEIEEFLFNNILQAAAYYKYEILRYAICSAIFDDMHEIDDFDLDEYFYDRICENDYDTIRMLKPYIKMWQAVDVLLDINKDIKSIFEQCVSAFNGTFSYIPFNIVYYSTI